MAYHMDCEQFRSSLVLALSRPTVSQNHVSYYTYIRRLWRNRCFYVRVDMHLPSIRLLICPIAQVLCLLYRLAACNQQSEYI